MKNKQYMNNTTNSMRRLHAVLLCALAFMLPLLNSCQKESVNTTDLLSTVPSSAGTVVGFNLKSMLEKAGCKVEGAEIKPGKEIEALLKSESDSITKDMEAVRMFLNGESGIDPSAAIFFSDAYNSYVTAAIADMDKFKAFAQKQSDKTFTDAGNGVEVCENVAVKGGQMWMAVTYDKSIDAKAIANFTELSEGQSYISKEFSKNISQMTNDIVGCGEITNFARKGLSFSEISTMRLFLGMLFDDADGISFTVDFLKGEAKASMTVLDSKGAAARYLLPSDKIDVNTVKSIGKNAELVAAMCVTKDLTAKIENIFSSFGSEMNKATESLKAVDGTTAVAFGDLKNLQEKISGVVTTDGKYGLQLLQLISAVAPFTKDGKLIRFSNGTLQGGLDIASAAETLKGSTFGFVASLENPQLGKETGQSFSTCSLAFVPSDGGLKCNFTLTGKDKNKNILLTVIEASAK